MRRILFRLCIGLLGGIACILLIGAGIWWWDRTHPDSLVSPLSRLGYIQFSGFSEKQKEKHVYGFLPYWTLSEATISGALTDIAYFSVGLDASGHIVESANGEVEMGWRRLQQEKFTEWAAERRAAGQKLHITVTMFDADTIAQMLGSAAAREQARKTLTQLIASYPFDGIQLDLEYAGTVTDDLRANYVTFVHDLSQDLKRQDARLELSVAFFASAASRYTFWDVEKLEPWTDFFIVMAYDYHIRSSPVVGPVAPIFGRGTGRWEHDVVTNMRDILEHVAAEKVMLGIPFYGYEWTSTSDEPGAATYPNSGATATYDRVLRILEDPDLKAKERWDDEALSPYVVYKERGQTQFIYYENTRSLSYKLDFVEQLGLRGIAIWALGYEGNRGELWDVIYQKFTPSTSVE